jgi:hypothetical protein
MQEEIFDIFDESEPKSGFLDFREFLFLVSILLKGNLMDKL